MTLSQVSMGSGGERERNGERDSLNTVLMPIISQLSVSLIEALTGSGNSIVNISLALHFPSAFGD